jgi:ABC-type Fe3+-citrate transport system substrate-binding protein
MSDEVKRLAPSEIEKLKSFIKRYNEMFELIEKMSDQVDKIEGEKTELIEKITEMSQQIEQIRLDEVEFRSALFAKYGEFNLNLENFEYQPVITE